MDGRRARLIDPLLHGVPRLQRAGARPAALTALWSAILGIGWPVAFLVSTAVEPVPADPGAPEPLIIVAARLVFLAALGTSVIGAARRMPVAAVAGVVAGVIATVFSAACPASGHHALGAWWFAQIGVTVAMLGASVAALGPRARE